MTNVIKHENKTLAVLVYLLLGSWIGVAFNLVYNRVFGPTIAPEFHGEKWIRGKNGVYVAIAGISAGVATFAYLFVARNGDPSILIALSQANLIYLAMYEGLRGHKKLSTLLTGACIVLIGAALTATQSVNGAIAITVVDILLLAGVKAGMAALGSVCMEQVRDQECMVNVAFWRFFWLAITATIGVPIIAYTGGYFEEFTKVVIQVAPNAAIWILLTMSFAYGANTLTIAAQKYEDAATVTTVSNASAVFAVPLTLLATVVFPTTFVVPAEPLIWLIRTAGSLLIVFGIYLTIKEE